jgi:hypothetical protein
MVNPFPLFSFVVPYTLPKHLRLPSLSYDGIRGYTPAECTVLGVPSITSNLTGFSNFMRRRLDDSESKGIFVVDRRFKAPHESVEQITNIMWRFCQLDRRQRIELRNNTERLSEMLDWKNLGQAYTAARSLALERHGKVMTSISGAKSTTTAPTTTAAAAAPAAPAAPDNKAETKSPKADVDGTTKRIVGWNLKSDS